MGQDEVTACHVMMDDAGLVLNVRLAEDVYVTKWVTLYGATYTPGKGCIIAFDAAFVSRMPLLGDLKRIILVGDIVVFEYTPLQTVGFCQ